MKLISAIVLAAVAVTGVSGFDKLRGSIQEEKLQGNADKNHRNLILGDPYGFLISNIRDNEDWCITVTEGSEDFANLGFRRCDYDARPDTQLWLLKGSGQILSAVDPNESCMIVNYGKNLFDGVRVRLADCDTNTKYNRFIHNGYTDKIRVLENDDYCLTNRGADPDSSDTIHVKPCIDRGDFVFTYNGLIDRRDLVFADIRLFGVGTDFIDFSQIIPSGGVDFDATERVGRTVVIDNDLLSEGHVSYYYDNVHTDPIIFDVTGSISGSCVITNANEYGDGEGNPVKDFTLHCTFTASYGGAGPPAPSVVGEVTAIGDVRTSFKLLDGVTVQEVLFGLPSVTGSLYDVAGSYNGGIGAVDLVFDDPGNFFLLFQVPFTQEVAHALFAT